MARKHPPYSPEFRRQMIELVRAGRLGRSAVKLRLLWVADITYIPTWAGFLYLAVALDAFSRRIVGWAMADHLRAELVTDALQMALAHRRPGPGLIWHSDQGSQPEFNRSSQHSRFAERIVAPWFVVLDRMMSVDVASVIAEAA